MLTNKIWKCTSVISRKSNFKQTRKCISILTCNSKETKMTEMHGNPTFSKCIGHLYYLSNTLLYLNYLLQNLMLNFYKCMYWEIKCEILRFKNLSNVSLMLSTLIYLDKFLNLMLHISLWVFQTKRRNKTQHKHVWKNRWKHLLFKNLKHTIFQ